NARGSVVVTKTTNGGNGTFTFTLTGGPATGVTMSATITTTGTPIAGSSAATERHGVVDCTSTERGNPDTVPVSSSCTAIVSGACSAPCGPEFATAAKGSVVVTKNTAGGNGTFTFTLSGGPAPGVTMSTTITTTGTTISRSGTA